MALHRISCSVFHRTFVLLAFGLALASLVSNATVTGQQSKGSTLRIGTSGVLTTEKTGKEESALQTLKSFIKEETGMDNEILRQKDWRELTDKLVKGELDLGVYQGFEYAWAQDKHPELKPLALAINVYTYPVAYVVTNRTNKAQRFADLQGQSFAIPATGQRFLQLFVDRECQATSKKPPREFFSKVSTPDEIEDALDDTVDGAIQAMVVDRTGLEAFKRRKPARFNQLKDIAHSQPFPPPLVAFYGKTLDTATLQRLRTSLLDANRKEKGETLLTLFRFTGFIVAPGDFDKVLNETRKAYPPPAQQSKAE
jgi:ABC-type phosphate/phosphonate transport system substrate-binding protein